MTYRTALRLMLLLACGLPLLAQNPYLPLNQPVFHAQNLTTGAPLAGGKLYSYAAGSTTPLATYASADNSAPNTNPVILDSAGNAKVFLAPQAYKFVLQDQFGSLQWTVDNISGAPPASAVPTVFGRSGNVAAMTGDYSCGQVTGAVCALPSLYYQQIQAAGAGVATQRPSLNLLGGTNMSVVCVDNSANASTDCTYTYTPTVNVPVVQSTRLGGQSCATGSDSYSTCTSVLTFATAFADTNYNVSCTGIGPTDTGNGTSGRAVLSGVVSTTANTVTVQVATQGSTSVYFKDVQCVGVHP